MPPTLCIFNEQAGPNLTPHEHAALFSQLEVKLGAIQLAVTQASAEVEPLLQGSHPSRMLRESSPLAVMAPFIISSAP